MGLLQYILLQVHFGRRCPLVPRILSTCYYLTYTWNEELHATWKDLIKSSRPSEKEKPVGGIFGRIFPDTDQLHHLIGLDLGCHLLGQKKCSSKPFNTTALQDRTSEYPSFQNSDVFIDFSIHQHLMGHTLKPCW